LIRFIAWTLTGYEEMALCA